MVFDVLRTLRAADILIIPGTGLLTDACGLMEWGPYNLFKWCLIARMRGRRFCLLVSVSGRVYSALGKYFVKAALSLANFRSYRDYASLEYLRRIGFETNGDPVYPDLVFGLPRSIITDRSSKTTKAACCLVGIGLMAYAGKVQRGKPQ